MWACVGVTVRWQLKGRVTFSWQDVSDALLNPNVLLPPPSSPLWSQLPHLLHLWPQPKAKVGRLLPRQHNNPVVTDCWPREPKVTVTMVIVSSLPLTSKCMTSIQREGNQTEPKRGGGKERWTDGLGGQKEDACADKSKSFKDQLGWPVDLLHLNSFRRRVFTNDCSFNGAN